MKTENTINYQTLDQLATDLLNKKVGIFPCDTIWGLIGIFNKQVCQKLYEIKKRPQNQPFLILIPNLSFLDSLIKTPPEENLKYINEYWPGPTTFIFTKKPIIPDNLTAGKKTIGIRLPAFTPLNYLLTKINQPLISSSLNFSNSSAITDPTKTPQEILNQIDFFYQDFTPYYQKPSAIIDLTVVPVKVIR